MESNEPETYTTPKLSLFTITPQMITEPSGMLTPPHRTTVSVPFKWEEQPGKPRPCTDIIIASTITNKYILELPPRLAMLEYYSNKVTKTCSPTTVLDGPNGKSVFSSSSFRFSKDGRRRFRGQMQHGSFDSNCSGGWSPNEESCQGGSCRLKSSKSCKRDGGLVVLPSVETCFSDDKKMRTKKLTRNGSLSKVTRSHFWATIYEGFKQVVVPWRKKSKKESFNR